MSQVIGSVTGFLGSLPEEMISKARWGTGGAMIPLAVATPLLLSQEQQSIFILLYVIFLCMFVAFNMLQLDRIQQHGIWVLIVACVLIPGHLVFQPPGSLAEWMPTYATVGSLLLWNGPLFLDKLGMGRQGYEPVPNDMDDMSHMEQVIGLGPTAGSAGAAGSSSIPNRYTGGTVSSWLARTQVAGTGRDTSQPASWPPSVSPSGSDSGVSHQSRGLAESLDVSSDPLSLSANGSVQVSMSSRCRNVFFPGGIPNRLRTTQSILDAGKYAIHMGTHQFPGWMGQVAPSPSSARTEDTEGDREFAPVGDQDLDMDILAQDGSDLVRFSGHAFEARELETHPAPP